MSSYNHAQQGQGIVKNYYTKEVIIRQGNSMYTEGGVFRYDMKRED